jgi:hypothetical protein
VFQRSSLEFGVCRFCGARPQLLLLVEVTCWSAGRECKETIGTRKAEKGGKHGAMGRSLGFAQGEVPWQEHSSNAEATPCESWIAKTMAGSS